MDKVLVVQVLSSVVGISIGQVFLKLGAMNLRNENAGLCIASYCVSNYLIMGIAVLGAATLLWVWSLRSLPLSIAYPFMALAFVFVPLLSLLILGEPLGWKNLISSILIISGVILVAI